MLSIPDVLRIPDDARRGLTHRRPASVPRRFRERQAAACFPRLRLLSAPTCICVQARLPHSRRQVHGRARLGVRRRVRHGLRLALEVARRPVPRRAEPAHATHSARMVTCVCQYARLVHRHRRARPGTVVVEALECTWRWPRRARPCPLFPDPPLLRQLLRHGGNPTPIAAAREWVCLDRYGPRAALALWGRRRGMRSGRHRRERHGREARRTGVRRRLHLRVSLLHLHLHLVVLRVGIVRHRVHGPHIIPCIRECRRDGRALEWLLAVLCVQVDVGAMPVRVVHFLLVVARIPEYKQDESEEDDASGDTACYGTDGRGFAGRCGRWWCRRLCQRRWSSIAIRYIGKTWNDRTAGNRTR